MRRETFNIFFEPVYLYTVTDRINRIIADNRKYNFMIESVGVLKNTLSINNSDIDEEIKFISGSFILRVSSECDENAFDLMFSDPILEDCDTLVVTDAIFPDNVFFADNIDDSNIFVKKVKAKSVTSGHLAEMEMGLLGVVQDTCHSFSYGEVENDHMARVNAITSFFMLPGGYVLDIDRFSILGKQDESDLPGFSLSHPDKLISLRIPPCSFENAELDCMYCYILNNYEDWIIKLEAYNKLAEFVKEVKHSDGSVSIELAIPEDLVSCVGNKEDKQ